MLLVRRPFKSLGKVYTAGSVITDPACIKRLKGKLAEGKIIEVTEQTYPSTAEYFKAKFGVDIPPFDASNEEPVKALVTEDAPIKEASVTKEPSGTSKEEKKVIKVQAVSK